MENIPNPSLFNIYPSHYQFDNTVMDNVRDVMDGGMIIIGLLQTDGAIRLHRQCRYTGLQAKRHLADNAMYYGLLTMPCYLFSIKQDIFKYTHISILSCHGNVIF